MRKNALTGFISNMARVVLVAITGSQGTAILVIAPRLPQSAGKNAQA